VPSLQSDGRGGQPWRRTGPLTGPQHHPYHRKPRQSAKLTDPAVHLENRRRFRARRFGLYRLYGLSGERAAEAGLGPRELSETVADTWTWREAGTDPGD
jgi:hypothetical protein